jgi:hypothetical protein
VGRLVRGRRLRVRGGRIGEFAPLSSDGTPRARDRAPGRRAYGRLFADLRRYNRLTPDAQLNFRLVGGGWVHGDPLPAQRRLSVGGPGALAGTTSAAWPARAAPTSSSAAPRRRPAARGRPAPGRVRRVLLGQAEYRTDVRLSLFSEGAEGSAVPARVPHRVHVGAVRRRGARVARRAAPGGARLPGGSLPGFSTFLSDVGAGVDFGHPHGRRDVGPFGVYVAKSVSRPTRRPTSSSACGGGSDRAGRRARGGGGGAGGAPGPARAARAQRAGAEIRLSAAPLEEGPLVRVVKRARRPRAARPPWARLPGARPLRAELWTLGGWFNDLRGAREWDLVVKQDALSKTYEVARIVGDQITFLGRYAALDDASAAAERPFRVQLAPPRGRRAYYNVAIDVETLSLSDLDEVERWLRGELRPAVQGRRSAGTALGRGVKVLAERLLGGETRHYEVRSETFRP